MLLDMSFCFSVKIMALCHALSNALNLAIHLTIYGIFFKKIKTKHYDLYQLCLRCHMDIFLGQIMSF